MPTHFIRLVVICSLLAAAALLAPRIAPDLLASALTTSAPKPPAPAPAPVARSLSGRQVTIDADAQGHFYADATVEGRTIPVVVDTGATTVALTAETARRLGYNLSPADYKSRISTANGVVGAAPVVLSDIRIGNITIYDVAAMVVPGDALGINLLGMTFLSRLTKFEIGGGQLVLTE